MATTSISKIQQMSEMDPVVPAGLSFFDPYLRYYVKQTLETGGEVYVSRNLGGDLSGIFIYDTFEKDGTIFTRSKEVFERFYNLKPAGVFFSELRAECECETYGIYTLDLERVEPLHRFTHEVLVGEDAQTDEIGQFMTSTHPGMNRDWVSVALRDGEKCIMVRLGNEIAGVGWVSLVNGIGRLHSLFVRPPFRKLGIGGDILFARLLWLRSKRARSAFSEIARDNVPSSRIALKGQMRESGQMFQYFKKEMERKLEPQC